MKKTIVCKLQVEGVHQWAECPFEEVKFLKNSHRHIFYINCEKEVCHNDRDIEFIMFKRKIIKYLNKKYSNGEYLEFNNMSCEMISIELMKEFELAKCEVFEDNENGAIIYA